MAISKQLKDEADRTIAGISDYYEKYGDSLIDAEEREHRISKVTAALEGCNGLTEKEKIQKTAENLFGLTCTWERDSLALKRELILNRETTEKAFEKYKKETSAEIAKLGKNVSSMDEKIDSLGKEIDGLSKILRAITVPTQLITQHDSIPSTQKIQIPWYYKIIGVIDRHFGATAFFVLVFLLLLIFSGNLEWVNTLIQK